MEKLWIIVQREYLTRIRKRSFILGTLLAPVGMLVYFLVIVGFSKYQSSDQIRVAVLDDSNLTQAMPDDPSVRYVKMQGKTLEELKPEVTAGTYNGVLLVPALTNVQHKRHTVFYYSNKKLTPEQEQMISRRLERKIRDYKVKTLEIDESALEALQTDVNIDPENLDGTEDKDTKFTTGFAIAIGFIMAFVMFFMVLMYGQMVMRSVMEEKVNRIVEVMMSSVKPFQLMLGKIIGAGFVGFTQVLIWIILNWGVLLLVNVFFAADLMEAQQNMPQGAAGTAIDPDEAMNMMQQIMNEVNSQNWWKLLFFFILYFLGGYLIYASLFAAIGSTISDDLGEGQALTLPVTIPIILSFYLIAFAGVRDPNSGLMVFASIFPLSSPIVMPFRLAFDPPWWQIGLSVVCLIAGTLFFVWLAGRIYRIGILLYGKKVSFKELGKWLFYP